MNAAKAPTDDIKIRKLVMHSIDKAAIIQKEMYGQASVADSLFPRDAPYCDIDLTPRWDYDFEKANLLNCPDLPAPAPAPEPVPVPLILGLSLGIGLPLLAVIGAVAFYMGKRSGYNKFGEEESKKREGEKTPPSVVGVTEEASGEQRSA